MPDELGVNGPVGATRDRACLNLGLNMVSITKL